jgi:hypothetical protein
MTDNIKINPEDKINQEVDAAEGSPSSEQTRQLAMSKISRRYAAYIVPAALAVITTQAAASP